MYGHTIFSDKLAYVAYSFDLTDEVLAEVERAIDDTVVGTGGFKTVNSFAVAWKDISFFGGNPASTPYPVSGSVFLSFFKYTCKTYFVLAVQ